MEGKLIKENNKDINRIDVYSLQNKIEDITRSVNNTTFNIPKIIESQRQIVSFDYSKILERSVRIASEMTVSTSDVIRDYNQVIIVDYTQVMNDFVSIISETLRDIVNVIPQIVKNYKQLVNIDYSSVLQELTNAYSNLSYNMPRVMNFLVTFSFEYESILKKIKENYYYYQFVVRLETEDNRILFIFKQIYETGDTNLIKYVDSYQTLVSLRYLLIEYKKTTIFILYLVLFCLKKKATLIEFFVELCTEFFGLSRIHTLAIKQIDSKLEKIQNQELIEYS